MWSAGCVIAEIFTRTPLFNGVDPLNQLLQIAYCIGRPEGDDLELLRSSPSAMQLLQGLYASAESSHPRRKTLLDPPPATHAHTPLPTRPRFLLRRPPQQPSLEWKLHAGNAPVAAFDLVRRLLVFSHTNRLNVHQALAHEFLAEYRQPAGSPVGPDATTQPQGFFFTNQPQAGAGGAAAGSSGGSEVVHGAGAPGGSSDHMRDPAYRTPPDGSRSRTPDCGQSSSGDHPAILEAQLEPDPRLKCNSPLEALQNAIFQEMMVYHPEVASWKWGADWAALDASHSLARYAQQAV